MKQVGKIKKELGPGTSVRGVRLDNLLWRDLESLAGKDKRNLNNYISVVLQNQVDQFKHMISLSKKL